MSKTCTSANATGLAVAGAQLALWSATGVDLSGWIDLINYAPGSQEPDAADRAEQARLARESELKRVAMESYMEHRDATDEPTSKEWVLTDDPLAQDPVALSLMAGLHDGDVK